ncbi:3-oxoacyl-ACP reductase FabG [Arthrobacter oryzae]|uniref:3-oxoacyl-ACP reductase FabG n=1 Tax=Arthrobacter oryzae TaxID=409290 RepID=UPI0028582BEE|nr:3-oxoacyl-ACP reductase FabG [Arthrobacter oryzae]MDR6508166.1 3-oxoacyl-[acyl-carrier protein] reductase [Arthrobacter oryzae]
MNQNKPVAVVTGGARGIGEAVARRLAHEGFAVAVLDLDAEAAEPVVAAIRETGQSAVAVGVDVTDEVSVEAAIAQVEKELGPPIVLVNNAGITRDDLLHKLNAESWDTVLAVHLRGAFLVSRAVQRHMTTARWGRIVNLSSVSALGNRGQANYSAAKAGIQGFTKTLALELGRFGVTVNAVAPGFIVTDMTRATAERVGLTFDEFTERAIREVPVQRAGQPEDVASAVAYFVREDASYVSGQVLYVAGGPRS